MPEPTYPKHEFTLNGKRVTVNAPDDERVLWVLRDRLGVTGPHYGCGMDVCKACTCHMKGPNGPIPFRACSVQVKDIEGREITTIEGLAATVGKPLHPVQEAWIKHDVAQCGYCQPGQIMNAVALINEKGSNITDADLDELRNMCRCGTYHRIREAIQDAAANM